MLYQPRQDESHNAHTQTGICVVVQKLDDAWHQQTFSTALLLRHPLGDKELWNIHQYIVYKLHSFTLSCTNSAVADSTNGEVANSSLG